ncbi:ABC transporter [Streptomyces sp. NPDC057654]|uniref:ABC transporter n=1 Tax=Streptomyces sp. NPDC057654 TaxID=3346196 RepID=UPI00369CE4EC
MTVGTGQRSPLKRRINWYGYATLQPLTILTVRATRTAPLAVAAAAALLLSGGPALAGGLEMTDVALLMRSGAVLLALGSAFILDDPAARTTEVVPVPRWLPRALRAALAVLVTGAAWGGVVALGTLATTPAERPLLPAGGMTLEALALLALALALAALGLRLTPGSGGALAAPGMVLCVLAAVLLPLPDSAQPFAQPLSPGWDTSRWTWTVLLCATTATAAILCREPSAKRHG